MICPYWVIRKNGYFYRSNYQGYTEDIGSAGLYSEHDAKREASTEPNMQALPITDFENSIIYGYDLYSDKYRKLMKVKQIK